MNISTPRPGISGRSVVRAAALLSALPVALVGYSAVAVAAAAPMCAGHHATKVVTSHSAHRVRGTSHRDVILIRDAGHVVLARGGNDLVCGSAGADVVRVGQGGELSVVGDGIPEDLLPVLEILPLQQLALRLAIARGQDPDRPRGLSKVTRTW